MSNNMCYKPMSINSAYYGVNILLVFIIICALGIFYIFSNIVIGSLILLIALLYFAFLTPTLKCKDFCSIHKIKNGDENLFAYKKPFGLMKTFNKNNINKIMFSIKTNSDSFENIKLNIKMINIVNSNEEEILMFVMNVKEYKYDIINKIGFKEYLSEIFGVTNIDIEECSTLGFWWK